MTRPSSDFFDTQLEDNTANTNVTFKDEWEEFIKTSLKLAKDEVDLEVFYQWICDNVRVNTQNN